MKMKVDFALKFDLYFEAFKEADEKARIKTGIQLINNIVNGEGGDTIRPPIDTGTLWGSGSVFLGSQNIYITPPKNGLGSPNTSHSGKKGVITIGFNTEYATKMHNEDWNPGPISRQAGGVGKHYVIKHLASDRNELMTLYATFVKKETGG